MSAITPGPWHFDRPFGENTLIEKGTPYFLRVKNADGAEVAIVPCNPGSKCRGHIPLPQARENAAKIARLPEILESLADCAGDLENAARLLADLGLGQFAASMEATAKRAAAAVSGKKP